MSRLVVGVVAHESRRETAQEVADKAGALIVSFDDGAMGCAGNHAALLHMLAQAGADWSVVVEDDAQPVDDFPVHVERALAFTPAPIVGLYLGTGNPSGQPQRQIRAASIVAARRDLAWIIADCLIGSVGYAIRTSLIEGMLPEIAERAEEWPLRVTRWAQDWGIQVAYTVPSLVDHADLEPVGHPPGAPRSIRRAWKHGTRRNWNTAAVPLGYCNEWSTPT